MSKITNITTKVPNTICPMLSRLFPFLFLQANSGRSQLISAVNLREKPIKGFFTLIHVFFVCFLEL